MLANLRYRLSILWGRILAWDHHRVKRKRYQNMQGQDD
jgi:hypothetical protein